jgi:hypothetical protein
MILLILFSHLFLSFYTPPQILLGKSRRMRWAGHVARMEEECVQDFDGKARRKGTTWKTKA